MSEKAASPESNVLSPLEFERDLYSVRNMGGSTKDVHQKLSDLAALCPDSAQQLISEIRAEITLLRSDLELCNDEIALLEGQKDEADSTAMEASMKLKEEQEAAENLRDEVRMIRKERDELK